MVHLMQNKKSQYTVVAHKIIHPDQIQEAQSFLRNVGLHISDMMALSEDRLVIFIAKANDYKVSDMVLQTRLKIFTPVHKSIERHNRRVNR